MKTILLAALAGVLAAAAEAQTRLTFDAALQRALLVNNTIERTRQGIDLAEARRDQLLSAVLPRITLNGDLTRNSIEQRFGEGDEAIAILPQNDWAYRVILEQPVYAGRRELRAYSQAKINVQNAREGTRASEDSALLRVAASYLAVVNADRRVEVEKQNIELAERLLRQAQAFYEAGEVTRVDVLRAETQIKASQRVLTDALQLREHAVSQLRVELDLDGTVEVVPPDRPLPPLPGEAELIARAQSARADVDIAENNVRIANLEVAKQRGFWLPVITFDGGWIQQRTPFPANEYAYGALRFTVPIFQSGEVIARVAGARSMEKEAEIALEEAQVIAREDVRRALADLRSAEIGLQLANEQLLSAQAEYDQSFDLYRAQEATSLDVAASELSLANARRGVAEETLHRDLSELRVWFAAGDIKAAVGVAEPAQPEAPQTN